MNTKGTTIFEVLLVVSIIGTLSGIATSFIFDSFKYNSLLTSKREMQVRLYEAKIVLERRTGLRNESYDDIKASAELIDGKYFLNGVQIPNAFESVLDHDEIAINDIGAVTLSVEKDGHIEKMRVLLCPIR